MSRRQEMAPLSSKALLLIRTMMQNLVWAKNLSTEAEIVVPKEQPWLYVHLQHSAGILFSAKIIQNNDESINLQR